MIFIFLFCPETWHRNEYLICLNSFIFQGGVLAVHCKDVAFDGRSNLVVHCIGLHMFPNQFLQGLLEIIKEKSR